MVFVFDYISLGVRLLGILFILLGVIRVFVKAAINEFGKKTESRTSREHERLRRQLSSYLLLGLELLIAGDIIRTILDPTLEEMAVLGSIVAVRTVISYFLNREIDKADRAAKA